MNASPADRARDAAKMGDTQQLRSLFNSFGADAVRGSDDPNELTSLHWAAAGGHLATIRYLMSSEVKSDVNALKGNNFSPLHAAAMQGNSVACEELLNAGADPNVQTDPQGYAPIHSASWGGHLLTVEVLLRFGARRDLTNYHGESPAETAQRQGHAAVVAMLSQE